MPDACDTNRGTRADLGVTPRTDLSRQVQKLGKIHGSKKFSPADVTDRARRTDIGEGRADQQGHGGIRTEEHNMQRDKQRKSNGKSSRRGGASPRSPDRVPAEVRGNGSGERLEQVSFRVRQELKAAILDEARRRRMTVQTFILLALRSEGVPVLDSDLEDLRVGAPRRSGSAGSTRSDPSAAGPAHTRAAPSAAVSDLNALTALLAAALMRSGAAQPSNIIVSNCGCRADERSAQPAKRHNLKRRDQ
jgi:hypothetical protein